ncbi:phage gene 29 protein family protein [Corynebacterium variabile]|uniref:phage gene 29 protein family protein n=1 Tax=Corynebacterium variabile TaxID=1727 RepID=UPI003FD0DC06
MATPDPVVVQQLEDLIRDVPGNDDMSGPVYPVVVELAHAIAVHLAHCGVRAVDAPDRVWTPPVSNPETSFMNPGKWRAVDAL